MGHFFTQRGNTLVGFILGLVVGLTVALGVAVYVTKVPIPFLNKGLTRNAEQDAAEEKKNKDWDPNAPLYGKTPAANAPAEPAKPVKPGEVAAPPQAPAPAPGPAAPCLHPLPRKTRWVTWPQARRSRPRLFITLSKWGLSAPAKRPKASVPNWL
jgi:cell division protein FtsN